MIQVGPHVSLRHSAKVSKAEIKPTSPHWGSFPLEGRTWGQGALLPHMAMEQGQVLSLCRSIYLILARDVVQTWAESKGG